VTETVRIRSIAAGGDGVGTLPDGRTVFVPRTAPGDLVELDGVRLARSFARARIARLLEAGPGRATPACRHYERDDCGGCQLQHLDGETQRAARRHVVGDALRRIGHLDAGDPELEPSENDWEYRTKVTLASRGQRIGYHRLGDAGRVFELEHCPIARPELNRLWRALRSHRRSLPGNLDQLVLRVDRRGSCHAIVRTTGGDAWTRGKQLGKLLAGEGVPAVLWWEPADGAARTVFGANEAYPVMVFEQVHPAMGDRVRAHAVEELGEVGGRHVWDLYAGIGETTRALADRGASVESVEADPRAVRVAERAGEHSGVIRHVGRVEEWLRRLKPAELAIVNPPRTGLAAEVASKFSEAPVGRLVYVSCDAATLARDLSRLGPAYQIASIRAFDLFPQTAHIETVVSLARR
jgi:23S rRNA (uracil1939-C5)-methyltransferase